VAVALEDAGFELKDTLAWIHNTGVPWGSRDISKAMDAHFGAIREVTGRQPKAGKLSSGASARQGLPGAYRASQYSGFRRDKPITEEAIRWSGFGTRLKPSREDILLVQRPLSESSYERNILRWGTGALNIDAVRVPSPSPPLPNRSNGMRSPQEHNRREGFRDVVPYEAQNGFGWRPSEKGRYPSNIVLGHGFEDFCWQHHFHVAKPVGKERWGHPCAKPVPLLRMLVRLCCPLGGLILDPYAGCASAGEAALRENFGYVGIELDPIYAEKARQRLNGTSNERLAE
jgi:site-specific DNA-methyltransferase (adenine-specific)